MLSKNFIASMVLGNIIPSRLKTDSEFLFFVGEMRFIISFGFSFFVSISFGRVPVGEMGSLTGSIGCASRLFPDPYREFRRDDLFGRWVRFFLNLVGRVLHLFLLNCLWARFLLNLVGRALHLFLLNCLPIMDSGFLRVLHQVSGLMWNLPVLRVAEMCKSPFFVLIEGLALYQS